MGKNILFTYITPFHPNKGGVGRVTHSLAVELIHRGYNVYYLIYKSAITVQHEYSYPAPLTYLPSGECLSKDNIDAYYAYLREHKIDIVINQSGNFSDSELWLKAKDLNIPVISVLHSCPWLSYHHLWKEIYPLRNGTNIEKLKRIARVLLYPRIKWNFLKSRRRQFRMMLPKTDYVCALSEEYFKEISEICPGYENKYRAIPNPNSYNAEQILLTGAGKKKQILWVGLFSIEKRPIDAIKIWKRLHKDYPDWEFVVVGYDKDGQWEERMRGIARGIPNIRFVGYQNPLPYQLESSIFCMTSIYEGWSMVLTEAMQCGAVPVAYNSFASVTEIIENGRNGILIKPFSTKQYEKELRRLMDNPELLNKMSQYAVQDIKKYSVEKVVDNWEALFEECISHGTGYNGK